ncbi:MAG: site-specific integrase [Deltaproteobacteria bacterium]|nr:site-specific integrase [Deltaproteobacteria bacterium]
MHQDSKPFAPYWVSISFRRACKRAGIENFRFHDLRHDFASSLVQNGNDLYVVQHLLGHRDGRMTQRYAHLKLDNLRTAASSLEGGLPPNATIGGHKKGHSGNEKGVAVSATP